MEGKSSNGIHRAVFWPAAIIVLVFATLAIVAPEASERAFASVQSTIVANFNWYYVLIAAAFVVFCLWMGFSRFGDIKLGRDDDEPEFSLLSWFSLLFAAGMGIGLVFYGVSEPLSHFITPRPGVEGTPAQLAQQAMSQTFLHWGVHAWSIYVVIGLALAYAIHRRRRPISIRWTLEPLLGRRVKGRWGDAIDVVALVGTLFGVATSLGLGVLQIGAGLDSAGIISDPSEVVSVVLILVITCFVLFSVLSGVAKGMKWLSNANLILAAVILAFVLFAGPTQFLLREFVQSIGNYLQGFIGASLNVSAFAGAEGEAWQASWTTFYWGWWISWAPFVGVFIARISRGRTVRQFVSGVILVPTMITALWFAVLGGAALKMELDTPGTLTEGGEVNIEGALFSLLDQLPGGAVLTIGALVLIAIFFVTSADSGSLVMGMLASGGATEPKPWVRVFFACATSLLAIALLLSGGLEALKTAAIIIALPFSVIMIGICWSTYIAFSREDRAYAKARRAAFLSHIGDYYGLEVDAPLERPAVSPFANILAKVRATTHRGQDAQVKARAAATAVDGAGPGGRAEEVRTTPVADIAIEPDPGAPAPEDIVGTDERRTD
jgi:choline/glycine/proline betaine transport protein